MRPYRLRCPLAHGDDPLSAALRQCEHVRAADVLDLPSDADDHFVEVDVVFGQAEELARTETAGGTDEWQQPELLRNGLDHA
jgi:hypothetical protein